MATSLKFLIETNDKKKEKKLIKISSGKVETKIRHQLDNIYTNDKLKKIKL